MANYLLVVRYGPDGAKGVAREGGTARHNASSAAVEALGGKVEAFYFAFGEVDVFAIVDFPDAIAAVATSLMVNQTGVMSLRLIPLITPEEMDAAAKRKAAFRPPGA